MRKKLPFDNIFYPPLLASIIFGADLKKTIRGLLEKEKVMIKANLRCFVSQTTSDKVKASEDSQGQRLSPPCCAFTPYWIRK